MARAKPSSRKGMAKQSAARQRAAQGVLTDALAEAAWVEADAALAQALADLDEVLAAETSRAHAQALDMLAQSLARAARKRGLSRIGELAGVEPYDPLRHELTAPVAKPPKTVHIRARGVARGDEVLARPRVGAPRKKKRT